MFKYKMNNDMNIDNNVLDKTTHLKNEYTLNPNEWTLLFDGCSKGNPGEAGCGAVIYKNGTEVWSSSKYLGKRTNNQAEYAGLIMGLKECVNLKLNAVKVQGDSLLVINQMNLKYMVHSELLLQQNKMAVYLASQIPLIKYEHVYRKDNKRADELANMALINKTTIDTEKCLETKPEELEIAVTSNNPIKSAIAKMFKKQVHP